MFLKVFFNIGYIFYNFSFSFMSPVCHICMTLRGLRHSLKDVTKSRWKSNKRFVVVLVLISFTKGVALSVLLYWLKFQGKQTISDNFFFYYTTNSNTNNFHLQFYCIAMSMYFLWKRQLNWPRAQEIGSTNCNV